MGTIAPTASPIGWWDGLWARKSGAAGCMGRAAQGGEPVARLSHPSLPLTIATQALPTGWQDGVRQRRIGAARMLARAALQQLEAVLEGPFRLHEGSTRGCAGACAIFRRCSQHASAHSQVCAKAC